MAVEDEAGSPVNSARPEPTGADPVLTVMNQALPAEARHYLDGYEPTRATADETFVVYLSTPITTGPRLLEWLAQHRATVAGSADLTHDPAAEIVREEVIEENLGRLDPIRARIMDRWPSGHLIDPTTLTVPGWRQGEYHRFWVEVLSRFVDRVVFADGWHLSTGCTVEYVAALRADIPMEDASGYPIAPESAAKQLRGAADLLAAANRDQSIALAAADHAEKAAAAPMKDSHLAEIASSHNVASFISLAPSPAGPLLRHRFVRERNVSRSAGFAAALDLLMRASGSASVNVRTFRPDVTKGNPFRYGLTRVEDVINTVRDFSADGYHCIVNETIPIDDGGVSGVTLGGVAEFAPDDTPRVVEKGGTASLPVALAQRLLSTVYGEEVTIPHAHSKRLEFSVHPTRVGYRGEHVIVWESENVEPVELDVPIAWPNRVSRLLGDKTYGLLIADGLGMPVPATTAILRRVAPFRFGQTTGTEQWWMRTAPAEQTPGHFTTTSKWTDPFALLMKEDADGRVAGVLSQEGVDAKFSGATLPVTDAESGADDHLIEGVAGAGDDFMLGDSPSAALPEEVKARVGSLLTRLESELGSGIRIEWADDGNAAWVLQLHKVVNRNAPGVFSSGDASVWLSFDPGSGLDALRELISDAYERGAGIEVTKPIGLTSHVGDLLRRAGIPGRLRV